MIKLNRTRTIGGGVAVAVMSALGVTLAATPASAASTSTWDKIASCESGGDWHIDTGNGYYGGLQFSASTWRGYGGSGLASDASKSEQIRIAEKVLASQGWGAWPTCSARYGLYGKTGSIRTSSSRSHATVKHHTVHRVTHAVHHRARHAAHVTLSGKTYTVRAGDTLARIAAKLHVSGGWQRLADANANSVSDPNLIYVGQVLHLPA